MALMLVVPEEVTAYMYKNHTDVRTRTLRMTYGSKEAHDAGYHDGQAAIGRRQITEGAI